MAKGKKTGTAPGKKVEPGRTGGFEGGWSSKNRLGGGTGIGFTSQAASHASTDFMKPKAGKTGSGIKPRGAGRTPKGKGSGGNPGKK